MIDIILYAILDYMRSLSPIPLKRLKYVAETFYDFGFGIWINRLKLKYLVPLHKRYMRIARREAIPCPVEEECVDAIHQTPQRLRLALEQLGGAYVKLGQMLSLRADIIGEPIAAELKQLQDRVPAVPFTQIRSIIEKEFNAPLASLFSKFDQKPVGAASLAQVYHATLKDGTSVAVKVIRPGIEHIIRDDLLLLQFIARLIENHLIFSRPYHPKGIISEFTEWTNRELNLIHEATNIEHFRSLYGDDEHIFIPHVFWSHTSIRVLTMEFSDGIHLDYFKRYRQLKSSRKAIADIGMNLAFRQFFEHGFFHGDPHPGNFFVMKNNTLCLHDFGIVGRVSPDIRHELIGFYINFLEKDGETAIKHLVRMAHTNEQSNIDEFSRQAADILDKWFYSPTKGARISTSFYHIVISGAKYGVYFSSSIALLAKAIVTMESMALLLDPSFDITVRLRPYLNDLVRLQYKPEMLAKQGREFFMDSFHTLTTLPDAAQKLIQLARQGEMPVRLDAKNFQQIKIEIDRQADIRILSFVLVAIVLATAVILRLEGTTDILGIPLGIIGVASSIALGVQLLMRIRS